MKHRFHKILSLGLLLCALLSLPGFAAGETSYVQTVFGNEAGLSSGEANTIAQTADGYLWVGCYGGLLRFDGTSFTDFSAQLGTASIRSLFATDDGDLYIGTNSAGAYRLRDGVFTDISCEQDYLCVLDFAMDSDGCVYAASSSGLARMAPGAERLESVELSAAGEQLYSVVCDGSGRIWTLSASGLLFVLSDGTEESVYDTSSLSWDGYATALCASEEGEIWLGSSTSELAHFSAAAGPETATIYSTGELAEINRLTMLSDGRVLVCGQTGFGVADAKGSFTRMDEGEFASLSADWAMMDYEGNLWVASSACGLIRYCVGCYGTVPASAGLEGVYVNAVAAADGVYYVATDAGVLAFDGNWKPLTNTVTEALDGLRVRNLAVAGDGCLWLASYSDAGAYCYDPKTDTLSSIGTADGIPSDRVRVVYPLSDGRVLIGTQQGVVLLQNGVITASYDAEDGIASPCVLCALETDGRVFIGTDGSGIYELTDEGIVSLGAEQGLEDGVVLRMTADAEDSSRFFVCAGENLYYFSDGSFRLLSGIDKASGSFYNVYDRDGRIWLMQDAGILSVDKTALLEGDEFYTVSYGTECGLCGFLSANTWNWLDDDGVLWLSTRSGVSSFSFCGTDVPAPYPVVNSITVDDAVVSSSETIDIARHTRRVTVDVSSLLYADTADYLLSCQLLGFDEDAVVTTESHLSLSYTNLPGGDYTFVARVLDPADGAELHAMEVSIHREKKITETALFWILLVIAIAGLAAGTTQIITGARMKAMRSHQQQLQDITEQAMKTVARTIDAKDTYTKGHSIRVAIYSREIARRMGFSEEEQRRVYYIGLLHDIGKIGVPDEILNKKSSLTDDEFSVIQTHPAIGGGILQDFTAVPGIADGARYHHERFDGDGYCDHKAGLNIPVEARIICVADSYDAMQSNRCYRPSMTTERIVSELKKGAGHQFDPDIVPIMLAMIEDGTAPSDES